MKKQRINTLQTELERLQILIELDLPTELMKLQAERSNRLRDVTSRDEHLVVFKEFFTKESELFELMKDQEDLDDLKLLKHQLELELIEINKHNQ